MATCIQGSYAGGPRRRESQLELTFCSARQAVSSACEEYSNYLKLLLKILSVTSSFPLLKPKVILELVLLPNGFPQFLSIQSYCVSRPPNLGLSVCTEILCCVCMYTRRPSTTSDVVYLLDFCCCCCLTQGLLLAQSSPNRSSWLTKYLQRSSWFCLPDSGIMRIRHHSWFSTWATSP